MLREELQLLQEQGSYVGEVVKPMDKKKVLVKVRLYTCIKVMFSIMLVEDDKVHKHQGIDSLPKQ